MGIKGLLPCLQSITRHVNLEKYRGLTVAVDAMCWLHKGVFTGDVGALAKYQLMKNVHIEQNQGQPINNTGRMNKNGDSILASTVKRLDFDEIVASRSRNRIDSTKNQTSNIEAIEAMSKCIDYVTRHAMLLQKQFGLDIILVIDGDSLPIKQKVNEKRRVDKEEAFQQGLQAEKKGDNRQARKFYSRACSISYEMRHELIRQCKRYHIQFVVAPYEADAQMAKLAHTGDVDLIITEDSDLLVYGCPRVLFKVDFKAGKGEEIQLMRDLAMNDPLSFRHWNHDMFVYMCILAGCDYCEGIPGVGLQKAHKLVRIYRRPKKILNALQQDGKLPERFEESFWNAYRTFRHQRVYCSQRGVVDHLFEVREVLDEKGDEWNFLGPVIESSIGIGIAEGLLHPKERAPWDSVQDSWNHHQNNNTNINRNYRTKVKATPQRKRLPIDRSPIEKAKMNELEATDKKLFAFFKSKRRKEPKRPPLEVIAFDENSSNHIRSHQPSRRKSGYSKMIVQSIPSNYHDYSSHLVSNVFKPISSHDDVKSKDTRRSGVSKAIRELKQKLSKQRSDKKKQVDHKAQNVQCQSNEGSYEPSLPSRSNFSEMTQPGIDDEERINNFHSQAQFNNMAENAIPYQYDESSNEQFDQILGNVAYDDSMLINNTLQDYQIDDNGSAYDDIVRQVESCELKPLTTEEGTFDNDESHHSTLSSSYRQQVPLHYERHYDNDPEGNVEIFELKSPANQNLPFDINSNQNDCHSSSSFKQQALSLRNEQHSDLQYIPPPSKKESHNRYTDVHTSSREYVHCENEIVYTDSSSNRSSLRRTTVDREHHFSDENLGLGTNELGHCSRMGNDQLEYFSCL